MSPELFARLQGRAAPTAKGLAEIRKAKAKVARDLAEAETHEAAKPRWARNATRKAGGFTPENIKAGARFVAPTPRGQGRRKPWGAT